MSNDLILFDISSYVIVQKKAVVIKMQHPVKLYEKPI